MMNISVLKKILVTNAFGFTGRHLAASLSCDPSLRVFTSGRIEEVKPDYLYHLEGSFTNDFETDYASNVASTQKLLETIRGAKLKTRVLLIGSSAEYGFPLSPNKAVPEDHPCNPVSIYGLMKLFQTELMGTYIRLYGMNIVAVRPFNLFGKGMSPLLFVGKMEQEIAKYKRGEIKKISTGSLSIERDYVDIAEAIKYYRVVMEKGKSGEIYNIGSGKSAPLRALLKRMLSEAGLSMKIVRETRHETPGKIVVPKIFADVTKIKAL